MALVQPALGALETVQVLKQLPIGLLVKLSDGRKGIVREREIAWDEGARQDWRTRIHPGETISAVVIKDESAQLELSLRLAVADPWVHAADNYQPGDQVTGLVSGLEERGVFIELEPGVVARLDQSRLPDWNRLEIRELFWLGDRVRAEVLRVDVAQREISLCMKNLLERRWPSANDRGDRPEALPAPDNAAVKVTGTPLPLEILASNGVRSILLVEDDLRQNQAIGDRLRQAGHRVASALDAEQGFSLLAQEDFDIILSDAGLPGMDGIEILRRVRQDFPRARAFLMTDWVTADQRSDDIAELEAQGARLLLKPLANEDLLHIFADGTPAVSRSAERTLAAIQPSAPFADQKVSVQQRLRQTIEEIRSLTRSTQAVLFVLRRDQRQIEVLDSCGRSRLNRQAAVHLLHSPVRDAAEDRRLVRIPDSQQAEGYGRYLLPLLAFRSCLGTPIPSNLADQYALFLFSPQPNAYGEVAEQVAQAGALALGALLEQQAVLDHMADMQRTLLVGHLTRALVHEANHQLGPIVFALEELQSQCTRVERSIGGPVADALQEMEETRKALRSLSQGLQNLMRTTKMFGRITVQDDVRMVQVNRVLERCTELLKDMADRAHVVLEFTPPAQILLTRARETLVQQILLNLLLNAVQQITLTRPATGGRVRATVQKRANGQGTMIRISVEDDGPGIHTSQWQRIFDLGMTTRKADGSGLGLFLADSLCQELGGRVFVDDSAILWGSRFVVDIPVTL